MWAWGEEREVRMWDSSYVIVDLPTPEGPEMRMRRKGAGGKRHIIEKGGGMYMDEC